MSSPQAIAAAPSAKAAAGPAKQGKHLNDYGLYRQSSPGKPERVWKWTVRVTRQGTVVMRHFSDRICGGEAVSLALARAYRDAVLLLIPPLTKRQVYRAPSERTRSGVVGVYLYESSVKGPYWQAHMRVNGRPMSRTFAVSRYGYEGARALAIAARQQLEQRNPDRFATVSDRGHKLAQASFSALLRHEQAYAHTPEPLPPAEVKARIHALDDWFDRLRPPFVLVYLAVSHLTTRPRLDVRVGYDGSPDRGNATGWSLQNRKLDDVLQQAWTFVRERLTALHSAACWHEFERRHGKAFFAFDGSASWSARFQFDRAGFEQHLTPPSVLVALLPNFKVPPLPPSKVQ